MGKNSIFYWVLRVTPAIILIQTLYFKFSAAEESVYIFETLGIEPYGRIGIGILELIIAILILVPKTSGVGGLLGMGVIAGAIFSHLTKLGIEVQGDGGFLFGLAIVTFIFCTVLVWVERKSIPIIGKLF